MPEHLHRLRFSPMLPEYADNENAITKLATNVVPSGNGGFIPLNVTEGLLSTGANSAKDLFCFDDEYAYLNTSLTFSDQILEVRNNAGTWSYSERSGANVSVPGETQFVRFGDNIICTPSGRAVQIQTTRGTNFSDCFNGPFRPTFKYCATLGERVVYANGASLTSYSTSASDLGFVHGFRPRKGDPSQDASENIGYVAVPHVAAMDTATTGGQFAIEVHFFLEELPAAGEALILAARGRQAAVQATTDNNPLFALWVDGDDNKPKFTFYDTGTGSQTVAPTSQTLSENTAYCLSGLFGSGNLILFLDGVRPTGASVSAAYTHNGDTNPSGLLIGTQAGHTGDGGASGGKAIIGEVRYWADAGLDGSATGDLTNTAFSNYDDDDNPIVQDPAIWLKFNELSGKTAKDEMGNSNGELKRFEQNGYINGGAWASVIASPGGDLADFSATSTLSITDSASNDESSYTVRANSTTNLIYLNEPVALEKSGNTITVGYDVTSPPLTTDPSIVWWSVTNNARLLGTEETHPAGRTGWQLLYDDFGDITGISGGRQFALIFKERAIYRMNAGGPFGFEFQLIATGIGTKWPKSISRAGDKTYFWGPLGPAVATFNGAEHLGVGRVSRLLIDSDYWIRERALATDQSLPLDTVDSAYSSASNAVVWIYKAVSPVLKRIGVAYSIDSDQFTMVTFDDSADYEHPSEQWGSAFDDVTAIAARPSYFGQDGEKWRPFGDLLFTYYQSTFSGVKRFSSDGMYETNVYSVGVSESPYAPGISTGWTSLATDKHGIPLKTSVRRIRPVFSVSGDSDVTPDVGIVVEDKDNPWTEWQSVTRNEYAISNDGTDFSGFVPTEQSSSSQYHRFAAYFGAGTDNAGKITEITGLDIAYTIDGTY